MSDIKFKLKNTKLYVITAIVFALAVISGWVLVNSDSPSLSINPFFVEKAGLVSLLFCVVVICFCVKVIFTGRIGLCINKHGITDNSSALSLGFISWKSVYETKIEMRNKKYLLLIYLNDREKYINSDNGYISTVIKINIKNYDCEAAIRLDRLKCSPDSVQQAIRLFAK